MRRRGLTRRPARRASLLALLSFPLALALVPAARGAAEPFLAYVYPAGGAAGSTCLVTVAGQDLKAASGLLVTGEGVSADFVEYLGSNGPLDRVQEEALKAWLSAVAKAAKDGGEARPAPPELPDRPEFRDLAKRPREELRLLAERYLNRDNRPKAPMAETAVFRLSIAPGARPGQRSLRLVAGAALSNPLVFVVGSRGEYLEAERFSTPLPGRPGGPEAPLVPPFTLNGQVFPGEVDRFHLRLAAGEEITCRVAARSLVPYLADAVPGFIQPLIEIADAEGRGLARADDEGRNPDPVLRFRAPAAGVYILSLRDAIYRGRFDFTYRIEVTRGPGAPPPDRKAGALPDTDPAWRPSPWSGSLSLPSAVEGVIAAPGEVDRFRFEAKAGETLVAELRARRDGSPLDGFLALHDSAGKLLASNDDTEDREDGLATQHADPYLRLAIPATGTYVLAVADTAGRGGPDHAYRLRLGPPRRDFAVLTDRSAINLPATGSAIFRAVVLRKDGWEGDVELLLVDPPEGLSLQGGLVPAGRDSAAMTLSFVGKPGAAPLPIRLEARGRIGDSVAVRPVSPRDRMMQAFAYNHYVEAEGLYLGFLKGRGRGGSAQVEPAPPIRVAAGGSVRVRLALPAIREAVKAAGGLAAASALRLPKAEPVEPPAGILVSETRLEEDGLSFLLSAAAGKAGFTDNLVLRVTLLPSPAAPAAPAASATGTSGDAKEAKPIDLGLAPAFRVIVTAP